MGLALNKKRLSESASVLLLILLDHLIQVTANIHYVYRARSLLVFLALVNIVFRLQNVIQVGLLYVFLNTLWLFLPEGFWKSPVVPFLASFVLSTALIFPFKSLRERVSFFKRGEISMNHRYLIVAVSLGSALALILWGLWTKNLGVAAEGLKDLRKINRWVLYFVFIPVFSLVNAFAEEVFYRGVVQEALSRVFRSEILVIFLQAASFAAVHYAGGFPNGVLGYFMVLVYGCLLGFLRAKTKGLLAPYLAHVVADFVIASFLVWSLH